MNYFFADGQLKSTTPFFLGTQPQAIASGIDRGIEPLGSVNAKARAFVVKMNTDQQAKAIVSDTAAGNIHTPMGSGAWSSVPEGIRASELTPEQRQTLLELIQTQLEHSPPAHAQEMLADYSKHIDQVHFAWYGGTGDDDPHAWAIFGPDLHIEYHDAQTPDNHVHTVWRRPKTDFGRKASEQPQSRVTTEEG